MAARVLIIEDNSANLELMSYLLTAAGHTVMTAADGKEGLEIAMRVLPDLIVCDVQMPEMNGYEFAKLLKTDPTLKKTPLVAVTAFAMTGDRDKAHAAGFDGYLAKPLDPEKFVRQLHEFLPANKHAVAHPQPAKSTPSPAKTQFTGKRILVLDNMQPNLDLARSVFEHAGYVTVTAKSVDQALRLAQQTPPDLIVSDICLPQSSGYEFIRMVKADPVLAPIPFVFLTSTALTAMERAEALSLGASRYLIRPIEPEQLLAEIDFCLRQRPSR